MTTNMVTITFHGFMAEKYAETVTLAGNTIEQIMNGLKSKFGPKFKEDIRTNDWHLVTGDLEAAEDALSMEELPLQLRTKTLHFIPVIQAAKKFFQIIVGIVLIVVGVVMNYYAPGSGNALIAAGIAQLVGGVLTLIFAPKMPNVGQQNNDSGSYYYNGAVNITSQGGVKPVIFGLVSRAGSVVISSDFTTKDQIAPVVVVDTTTTVTTDTASDPNYWATETGGP